MKTQNKNLFLVDKINEFGMKNIIALKPDDNEIPYDYDLCISELGNISTIVDNALVLNGFDEIGMFEDEFINPIYVFIREPAYVEGVKPQKSYRESESYFKSQIFKAIQGEKDYE